MNRYSINSLHYTGSTLKKLPLFFLFLLCTVFNTTAQTNISGIINSYVSVSSVGTQSVNVSSSAGFAVGDKVLLIQMKGATIDTTNTSTFGSITSYNDAGNYEMLTISAISSTTITFTTPILRTYNTSGLVQMVNVPVFNNVNITGALTCLPWNGSTGGVLVFEATGNVTLNANIDVTGKGFLGGAKVAGQFLSCTGNTTGFKLPNTSLLSGNKGEGIVSIMPSFAKGLGALANGGGAGNDVNGGGAGGGNYGLGGHGGNTKCSTSPSVMVGGSDGKNLVYSNINNKIFLGGGGGSGHENDGVSTGGVAGGGIVLVRCGGSISGNGNFIKANGNSVTIVAGNDGQGGGGAGGVILLEACSSSSLNISVTGGNGGTDNFSGPDCHGKGGGGGGGVIWTSSSLSYTSFLSGGNPGVFTNVASQCFNTSNGATTGQAGGTLTGLLIPGATSLYSSGSFSLIISSSCISNNNSTATATVSTTATSPVFSYSWTNSSGTIISQTNNASSLTNSVTGLTNGVYTLYSQMNAPCGPINTQTININCIITPTQSCGGSLIFNNASDEVLLPLNNQMYSSNGFTWECWFKLNTPFGSKARSLIMNEDPVVYEDIFLGFGWNLGTGNFAINHLGFKVDGPNATTGPTNVSCDYMLPGGFLIGTWYHTAGVMDYATQTAKLYLNGVLVDTKTVVSDPMSRMIQGHLSYSPNLALGGNMDEVRIWKKARTATEIFADYNHCLMGNEVDLLSYYRCNQSTGTIVIDATANGNNGTFANSTSWSTQQPTVSGLACSSGVNLLTSSPPTICAGSNTTLTASGATTYTWSTGIVSNSITVNPSVTTIYTVTGTAGTCTSQATSTVNVATTSTLSITGNPVICAGQTTTLTASGGGNYNWSPTTALSSSTGSVVIATPTITTTYSVTGASTLCSSPGVITINVSPAPTLTLSPNTTICQGMSSSATITASGAASYVWVNASTLSSSTGSIVIAMPNATTVYTVTGTANSCTNTAMVTVSVTPSPTITATLVNNTSCGLANGSATLTTSPASNTYIWSGVGSTTNTAVALAPGNYTVTVMNGSCQTTTVVNVLNSVALSIITSTVVGSNCNVNDGSISVTDNLVGSTYSWFPNVSTTNNATALAAGNYSLTISNGACNTFTVFNVALMSGPTAMSITVTNVLCEADSGSVQINGVTNGLAPYQYSFNNIGFSSVTTYTNLTQGTYIIAVKDANGCVHTQTLSIGKDNMDSHFDLKTIEPSCDTDDGEFIVNNIAGGTAPYLLNFNNTIYSSNNSFEMLGPGTYTLSVLDSNMCETDFILIMPENQRDYSLYIPNTFTPNKDEKNDTWFAKGTCLNSFNCLIYNRWGEKIAELKDINDSWDGTYGGKPVPDGVYVYLIEIETQTGTVNKTGHITVFR